MISWGPKGDDKEERLRAINGSGVNAKQGAKYDFVVVTAILC